MPKFRVQILQIVSPRQINAAFILSVANGQRVACGGLMPLSSCKWVPRARLFFLNSRCFPRRLAAFPSVQILSATAAMQRAEILGWRWYSSAGPHEHARERRVTGRQVQAHLPPFPLSNQLRQFMPTRVILGSIASHYCNWHHHPVVRLRNLMTFYEPTIKAMPFPSVWVPGVY